MMVARLARAAAERKGPESVAVISYCDQRAGAWSQIQMLCAQAGVDCLRANDPETLKMLLGEFGHRKLVLIDTPGVKSSQKLIRSLPARRISPVIYYLQMPLARRCANIWSMHPN
jgi:flagellar biosynthesis protein FlhF